VRFGSRNPRHATLAFAGRLVAVLGPVVQPRGGFDEHVLHARQFRNIQLSIEICTGPGSAKGHRRAYDNKPESDAA
jgi:hypothetical protein